MLREASIAYAYISDACYPHLPLCTFLFVQASLGAIVLLEQCVQTSLKVPAIFCPDCMFFLEQCVQELHDIAEGKLHFAIARCVHFF